MSSMVISHNPQQRPIVVIGAAVGDIVLTIEKLPLSGQDIAGKLQAQQVGGCAFNVARVLRKLGLDLVNGIAVGNGSWGKTIAQEMQQMQLPIQLTHASKDNGWCMALVEPHGERTFISIENGCECDWDHVGLTDLIVPPNSLVYLSGYELSLPSADNLRQWVLNLPEHCLRFIDLGPHLHHIPKQFLEQLLQQNTLLTLNRDEIALLCGKEEPILAVQTFLQQYPIQIIARLDKQGAWLCQPEQEPAYIPAYRVEVVDTIGAGDAHCGGVLAGLALGQSLTEAIKLGNKIAAISVSQCGAANPPSWDKLEQL